MNGAIFTEGDVDTFRFAARAGRQVVLRALAVGLGSRLDPALTLLDERGDVLASNDDFGESREPLIVYTPKSDGTFLLRVSDSVNTGSPRHVYRLTIGELPYLTSVYPLGRSRNSKLPVRVEGANLGGVSRGIIGASLPDSPDVAPVEVAAAGGTPLNRVQIALGRVP